MDSIQDDAMAQAILGAIKKGPRSDSQILSLFQRNRNAAEIDTVLSRLRQAKLIDFTTEATTGRPKRRAERTWSPYEKSNEKTPAPGKRQMFCSIRYPQFSIGGRAKFEAGFFATDSPQIVQLIEQSSEYNLAVHDITEVIRGIPKQKKIYLSSRPSVEVEYYRRGKAIEFEPVADGLYILACEDPELAGFVEHSQLFRAEQIREVPRTMMEVA